MVADMLVGFKAIREKFTSRVVKQRPEHLEVFYVDGPLKDLDNNWTFTPTEDGGCEVDFCVDFTFRNAVFEALAGQYFDRAFRKMVQVFEERADELLRSRERRRQSLGHQQFERADGRLAADIGARCRFEPLEFAFGFGRHLRERHVRTRPFPRASDRCLPPGRRRR